VVVALSTVGSESPSLVEARAIYEHAAARVVLYRRRICRGHGNAQQLAELERAAHRAAGRLRRAQAKRDSQRPARLSPPSGSP
jgi:hypothetical protein